MMMQTNNPYRKDSQAVFSLRCPECGAVNEVLESFAYWLKTYQTMQKGVVVTCGTCKEGVIKL